MEDDIALTWDDAKREATLSKRRLDFAHMDVFDWSGALTAEDSRRDYPEVRYVSIGYINDILVVCVWCYRNEALRIISLRKANARERRRYEQALD